MATRAIEPGTILIDEPPLAAIHATMEAVEGQAQPDIVALAKNILDNDIDHLPLFSTLYHGSTDRDMTEVSDPVIKALVNWKPERVRGIVEVIKYNASVRAECRFLSASQQCAPAAWCGLWGEYSKINHSCAPNAITYLVGHNMVVRAAKQIQPGDEITVSYIGASGLSLLPTRRTHLMRYGFTCSCPRCQAELEYFDGGIGDILEEVEARVARDAGVLQNLPRSGSSRRSGVLRIIRSFDMYLDMVARGFQVYGIPPDVQIYFWASLGMTLFHALFAASSAISHDQSRALSLALPALQEAACGSADHVSCAASNLMHANSLERKELIDKAQRLWEMAVLARYGEVDDDFRSKIHEAIQKSTR